MSNLPEKCFIYRVTFDQYANEFEVGAVAMDSGSALSYVQASYPSASVRYGGDIILVAPPHPTPSTTGSLD
jgi:hypothetical protein